MGKKGEYPALVDLGRFSNRGGGFFMKNTRSVEDYVLSKVSEVQTVAYLIERLSINQMLWLWLWLNDHEHSRIAEIMDISRQRSYQIQKDINRKAKDCGF